MRAIIAGLSLMIGACAAVPDGAPLAVTTDKIVGTWQLTAINRSPAPATWGLVVTFAANGAVTGTLACNSFNGVYELKAEGLSFRRMSVTALGCQGPGMEQFQATAEQFLSAKSAPVRVSGGSMMIETASKTFAFQRTR